jgi:hypothetical protein
MTTSLLEKYTRRSGDDRLDAAAADSSDAAEELGCWALLRGIRDRAMMLELIKKDGTILAVGYAWLERALYDPAVGIVLLAGGQKITIKGRNLNRTVGPRLSLFAGLIRHRVPWIREAEGSGELQADVPVPVIETIDW